MKHARAAGVVLALCWPAFGPAAAHAEAAGTDRSATPGAYVIAGTDRFILQSAEGRPYQVSVAHPEDPAPTTGYPVIYVLDPSSAFATLVETARNRAYFLGPVVVVGVGYPPGADDGARMRDLTPETDLSTLPEDNLGTPWGEMGGADTFLRFLLTEVKPAVETRLPIDKERQALFGHSLGGLFALHTLFSQPDAFQVYVAASPSIWWGGRSILTEARAYKDRRPPAPSRRLLITVGGLESEVMPQEDAALARTTKPVDLERMKRRYRDYIAAAAPLANCRELFELLDAPPTAGLEVRYVEFPGETHNSVIPAYLGRGLTFLLAPSY